MHYSTDFAKELYIEQEAFILFMLLINPVMAKLRAMISSSIMSTRTIKADKDAYNERESGECLRNGFSNMSLVLHEYHYVKR